MEIKKGDFVKLHYTGKVADSNQVFDTTKQDVAIKAGLSSGKKQYEAVCVCVGEGYLLKGLDNSLEGKKTGDTYEVVIEPDEGFGRKNPKLLKLMPIKLFKKQGINPQPGMPVTIDEQPGVVKIVSGNRVVVDFNHSLAGKKLIYEVEILQKVDDIKEQVSSLIKLNLGLAPEVIVDGKSVTVQLPFELPEQITAPLIETITKLTEAEKVDFKKKEDTKNK